MLLKPEYSQTYEFSNLVEKQNKIPTVRIPNLVKNMTGYLNDIVVYWNTVGRCQGHSWS